MRTLFAKGSLFKECSDNSFCPSFSVLCVTLAREVKVVGRAISKSLDGPWVFATSIGEQAVDYLYENYGYGEYSSSSV